MFLLVSCFFAVQLKVTKFLDYVVQFRTKPTRERAQLESISLFHVSGQLRKNQLPQRLDCLVELFLSTDSFHVSHTFQKIFQNQISLKVYTVSQIEYRRTVRIRNVRAKRHSINAPTVPFKLYQHTYQLSRDQTKATRQGRFVSASLGFEMILR